MATTRIPPAVTTFGSNATGARACSFRVGALEVLVRGTYEEDNDAASAMATKLAAAAVGAEESAGEPLTVEDACVRLCRGDVVVGRQYSVGAHSTAVPSSHGWSVLSLQGAPVVLAHDSFEVARAFVALEAGEMIAPEATIDIKTDADIEAAAFQERNWYAIQEASRTPEQIAADEARRAERMTRWSNRIAQARPPERAEGMKGGV